MFRRISHHAAIVLASICALLLAACGGSTTAPAAQTPIAVAPTTVVVSPAPMATTVPATEPPVITDVPSATEAPTEATAETAPTAAAATQPSASVQGEVVLRLGVGNEQGQVGIEGSGADVRGPRTFRIGSDGSIRVLDNLNKRLLFFTPEGTFSRVTSLSDAKDPVDFIVNTKGEMFVHDQGGSQVLRYAPNGKLAATIPVNSFVSASADGIMLNASQDLLLTQGNQTFWLVIFGGELVPANLQQLAQQRGAVTPRSPAIFDLTTDPSGTMMLGIDALTAGTSGSKQQVSSLSLNLPAASQFLNVDREMNLYFAAFAGEGSDASVDVRRLRPDGSLIGGARLALGGCATSWRTVYVDQVGAAWTMCVSDAGATVTRYALLDPAGQQLPEAANQAAETPWKPGPGFAAA